MQRGKDRNRQPCAASKVQARLELHSCSCMPSQKYWTVRSDQMSAIHAAHEDDEFKSYLTRSPPDDGMHQLLKIEVSGRLMVIYFKHSIHIS
jgi:hypothetical protein